MSKLLAAASSAWAVSFKEGMLAGQVRRTDHVCVNAAGKQRSSHFRKIRTSVFRSVLAKARSLPSIAVESRGYRPTIENIERKQLVSHSCETSQHLRGQSMSGLPADSHWMAGESIVSKREAPLGSMVTLWFAALG
jgi:hypothetical protein